MELTTLNLEAPAPKPGAIRPTADCPSCKAPAKQRIDGGGFGPKKLTLCGECGYEFPQS